MYSRELVVLEARSEAGTIPLLVGVSAANADLSLPH